MTSWRECNTGIVEEQGDQRVSSGVHGGLTDLGAIPGPQMQGTGGTRDGCGLRQKFKKQVLRLAMLAQDDTMNGG
jgi:hypothetical protein